MLYGLPVQVVVQFLHFPPELGPPANNVFANVSGDPSSPGVTLLVQKVSNHKVVASNFGTSTRHLPDLPVKPWFSSNPIPLFIQTGSPFELEHFPNHHCLGGGQSLVKLDVFPGLLQAPSQRTKNSFHPEGKLHRDSSSG